MGLAYNNLNNYLKAIESYESVLKIDSNRDDIRIKLDEAKSMVTKEWYRKGKKFFKKKRYDEAIKYYEKVLEIDPENNSVKYKLSEAKSKLIQLQNEKQEENQQKELKKFEIESQQLEQQESKKIITKINGFFKKGIKLIPTAVGIIVGIISPLAGLALYIFLRDIFKKIPGPQSITNEELKKITDDVLKKICSEKIPEQISDYLEKKLRKVLSQKQSISPEQLEIFSSLLKPLYEELHESLNYVKDNIDQIPELLKEWQYENRELISELQIDLISQSNQINLQTSKLDEILRKLENSEDKLNKEFSNVANGIFSLENITSDKLKLISFAQITNVSHNIRSPNDITYDSKLFIEREEANEAFEDFLSKFSSYNSKKFFLVLAGPGMGKTWTLIYWANRLLEQDFKTKNFVPFLISLSEFSDKFNIQLQDLTGTTSITNLINCLRKANDSSKLIPIILVDGLEQKRTTASIIEILIELPKFAIANIPIVIMCRDADWSRDNGLYSMQSDIKDYFFKPRLEETFKIKDCPCPPSLYLEQFKDGDEFNTAIERYQVPKKALYNDKLQKMARYPILLRLFSEYYQKYSKIPNPYDTFDFETLFLGEQGDLPETNILGRLDIIGNTRDFLVQLTSRFIREGTEELKFSSIKDLIQDKENFNIVRSAGLIIENYIRTGTSYKLNDLYINHLKHMVFLVDLVKFRGIKIPKIEADFIKDIEHQNKQSISEILCFNAPLCFMQSQDENRGFYVDHNQITKIFLANCNITSLSQSICNLSLLEELKLENNHILALPESIGNLEALIYLDLTGNELNILPESIGNLTSLKKLNLCSNKLKIIPMQIGNLFSLEDLDLGINKLESIPESIQNLKKLKSLKLDWNCLKDLPEFIGNLCSLEFLDLSHNQLKNLPASIGNLISLKWLNLSDNQLIKLPSSIEKLKSLNILFFTKNKDVIRLPISLNNMSSLKLLSIETTSLDSNSKSIAEQLKEKGVCLSSHEFLSKYEKLPYNFVFEKKG